MTWKPFFLMLIQNANIPSVPVCKKSAIIVYLCPMFNAVLVGVFGW